MPAVTASLDRAGTADDVLVLGLRLRDENAYLELVRRHTPLMLRVARSILGSAEAAEDVVQDTWVAVLRSVDGFEGRSTFETWLMRILVNTARSRRVRDACTVCWSTQPADAPVWDAVLAGRSAEAAGPLDHALAVEAWEVIRTALTGLPDRQRVVGLREVAEQLAGVRVDLLGQQADVVGVGDRPLERRGRPVDLRRPAARAWASQNVQSRNVPSSPSSPSRARGSGRRGPRSSVSRVGDGVDRGQHPRVVGGEEADDGHHQRRGVEVVAAERLGERAAPRRSSPRSRIAVGDLVARPPSSARRGRRRRARRRGRWPGRARPSTSASSTGSGAGSPRTSQMPWSGSRQRAAAASARSARNRRGRRRRARPSWSGSRCGGVEQLAVHVELPLVPRAVADADRAGCRASRRGAASSRSVRSCSPPTPNMICRSPPPATLGRRRRRR